MKNNRNCIKRLLSVFLMLLLVLSVLPQVSFGLAYDPEENYKNINLRFWEDEKPELGFYINASSRYILETVKEPAMGTSSGEWSVMDLLRGMYTGYDYINYIPENYYEDYIERIEQYVTEKNGNLDRNKITEWARLTLSLTSLGYDISDVTSYDFIEKFSESHRFSYRQGINGAIWTIIALNTGGYELYDYPENADANTVGKMIDHIMNLEITQADGTVGGWALFGKIPDADITGMALQALAPYYLDKAFYEKTDATLSYEEFADAVERAIYVLSLIQQENGAFSAFGNVNVESTVQVVVALTALNIDPLAESVYLPRIDKKIDFITEGKVQDGVWTNDMVNALLTFWANGSGSSPEVGGFKHVTTGYDGGGDSGYGVNGMATDQALYGLIAYDRFKKDKNALYDMRDMKEGEYRNILADVNQASFNTNGVEMRTSYSPYAVIEIPEGKAESGKVFKNWSTKADGSGTVYNPGEKLIIPEHDITLFAQYENVDYKINFEINGGVYIGENLPQTFTVDDPDIKLPTAAELKYEGYDFEGWYENADFAGTPVTVLANGSIEDKTFYAKWKEVEKEDQQVIEVINLIDSLPGIEEVTLADKWLVEAAREGYEGLTSVQKELVTNLSQLELLEAKLVELEKEADADAVKLVEESILSLPEVEGLTIEEKEKVEEARSAFYSLTAEQQSLVTNIEKFTAIEAKMFELLGLTEDEIAANKVEMMITGLPNEADLTLQYKASVEKVAVAFENLTEIQTALVPNVEQLELLQEKLVQLIQEAADLEAAKEVIKIISALPAVERLELTDEDKVAAARAAFDGLTSDQKELITNLEQLEVLEKRLVELGQISVDTEVAQKVTDAIANLPGLTSFKLADKLSVEAARAAFESLTSAQKELVSNLAELEALEAKIVELEEKTANDTVAAEKVQSLIDQLPDLQNLNLTHGELVVAAREAFENLMAGQKELVTNIKELESAEQKLAELKKANEPEKENKEDKNKEDELTSSNNRNNKNNNDGGNKHSEGVNQDTADKNKLTPGGKTVGKKLPTTATDIYNILMVGSLLILLGTALYFIRRKMA